MSHDVSGVSVDFPVQLVTCAYLIGRPAVCFGVVMPVCPCVVSFSKFHEPDTRDILARILVASSSDTSDTRDFLVAC